MKSKMTTNSQLSTTEPKKKQKQKLSKQLGEEQRNGDHVKYYQWGAGEGVNGGKGTGNKKHNW